ncbi:hypothetical protein AGR6A_Lc70014 [Agrobacterium sp. NCPPB 925]|nr:hypothetical protein AGR6A_Lc70014 [Agrobacterium sp. NCPPB 925]
MISQTFGGREVRQISSEILDGAIFPKPTVVLPILRTNAVLFAQISDVNYNPLVGIVVERNMDSELELLRQSD